MKVLVFCIIAISLAACVSNTKPAQNSMQVQSHTWRTENFRNPGLNTGLLVITRDTGMRGSSCIPMIAVNGEHVAPINVGEELALHLTANTYSLKAIPNKNCAASMIETVIEITEDKKVNLRLGFVDRSMLFTGS